MKKKSKSVSQEGLAKAEWRIRDGAPFWFHVLVNVGERANYSAEPRLRVSLPLTFTPSNRSSARQLRDLHGQIRQQIAGYLPGKGDFYAWLLDPESNQPCLFVSGLLAVREGRCSKVEAEALNQRLLPQVTCDQHVETYKFLVSAVAHASDYFDDYDDDEFDDCEYTVLDTAFGDFDYSELLDAEHSDGYVDIVAETWHTFSLNLPFPPTSRLSVARLRYIHMEIADAIDELSMGGYGGVEVEEFDIWVTDGNGDPDLFISGLLAFKEGRLSRRQMKRREQGLLNRLPHKFEKHCSAA